MVVRLASASAHCGNILLREPSSSIRAGVFPKCGQKEDETKPFGTFRTVKSRILDNAQICLQRNIPTIFDNKKRIQHC